MVGFKNLARASISCVWIVVFGMYTTAGEKPAAPSEREIAIRTAGKAYVEALRRGDAKALADYWTADGTYTDAIGRAFKARDLIKQQFGQGVATEKSTTTVVDLSSSIRFVTPDVAIEEGTFPGTGTETVDVAPGKYIAVWVKKARGWLLDSLSEREFVSVPRDNPLDAVSWMIGDWLGQGDGFTVTCSAVWSDKNKFIVRQFVIEQGGNRVQSATQRIGWDPRKHGIRSWGFDSDGGFVEGRWHREGDGWIVTTTGVLPDGSRSSAINFWLPEGADRSVLKTSHMMAGDTEMGESVVEFRRVNAGR